MIIYFVVLLVVLSVTCADNNNIVIKAPEHPPEHPRKNFSVYWNAPTFQCITKGVQFDSLYEKFGIIQNDRDSFIGNKVVLLYVDSLFPSLLSNKTTKRLKFINGGLPQEGDLKKHLDVFKKYLEKNIPDKDFDGIGIIDMEQWKPVFRQHFSNPSRLNTNVSLAIERKLHAYSTWWWNTKWLEAEAKFRFEASARSFMQETLKTAKKLRPRAKWGYYGFPYCYNMGSKYHRTEDCSSDVQEENDGLGWLWRESTALHPSLYSDSTLNTSQLLQLIRGRVRESARFGMTILPYIYYKYTNSKPDEFLREDVLNEILSTLYSSKATGFVIWGASSDVDMHKKCKDLLDYVENVLGPAIAKYTKTKQGYMTEELSPSSDHTDNIDNNPNVNKKLTSHNGSSINTVLGNSVLGDLIRQSTVSNLEENTKVTNLYNTKSTENESQLYGESQSTTANVSSVLASDADRMSVGTLEYIDNNITSLPHAVTPEFVHTKPEKFTRFSSSTTDQNVIEDKVISGVAKQTTINIDPHTPQDDSEESSKAVTFETFTREEFNIILQDGEERNTYNEYYNIRNQQNKGSKNDG